MTKEKLNEIVKNHKHWLNEDCEGWGNMRADLRGANLREANLSGANLREANLSGANLRGADLREAYLRGADLREADLRGADLREADLRGAYLSGADLRGAYLSGANLSVTYLRGAYLRGADLRGAYLSEADLSGANLRGAYLRGADLRGADLRGADLNGADLNGANLSESEKIRFGKILSEDMVGYKKCKDNVIVELIIPKGSIVFSINNGKCRTNHAIVKKIIGGKRGRSNYNSFFTYYEKDEITIKNFNLQYNEECASGIHFFRTLKEAEEYSFC